MATATFSLSIEALADATQLLHLEGEIDACTCLNLEAQLAQLLAQGHRRLILDMSHVQYISSHAASVISKASLDLVSQGGRAVMIHAHPFQRQVFRWLGLRSVVEFAPTRRAALSRFTR